MKQLPFTYIYIYIYIFPIAASFLAFIFHKVV